MVAAKKRTAERAEKARIIWLGGGTVGGGQRQGVTEKVRETFGLLNVWE